MARGGKPAKAKVQAKRPVAGRSPKKEASKVRELERRLAEALEQQAAASEILRVIRGSPNDVQPVFDAIVESAASLCHAEFSAVARLDEGLLHIAAVNNMSPGEAEAYHSLFPRPPHRGFIVGRAVVEGRAVHVEDVLADPDYEPRTLEVLQGAAPYRTYLGVPILKNGVPIGVIGCGRREVRPFTATQIELVKTFADQAVIAIENVRRLDELRARNRELGESLDRQTAMGEILRVISNSPTDVQPVFDMLARSARQLCDGQFCFVLRFDGERLHFAACHGLTPEGLTAFQRALPRSAGEDTAAGRAILHRAVAHIPDVHADPAYGVEGVAQAVTYRSIVAVPMLREGHPIGAIAVARTPAGLFPDRQVELLETFADQAVIAIQNVRLFKELESRNRDLTETLEQQTATGEILRIISTSPTNLQPVLETVAENAAQLCAADDGHIWQRDGSELHLVASRGGQPVGRQRLTIGRQSVVGRAAHDGVPVHVDDLAEALLTEFPDSWRMKDLGYRTILAVPLLREGLAIGVIMIRRTEVRAFTDKQVALVKTFADQAVIAIENVRLFEELEARNRDLVQALDQQTATGEILRVISGSPTDVQPVFHAIVTSGRRLCGAQQCTLVGFDGEMVDLLASDNYSPAGDEEVRRIFPYRAHRGGTAGRTALDRAVVHIPDVMDDPDYHFKDFARTAEYRAHLGIPMFRGADVVGVLIVSRAAPGPFSPAQIELLKTFADQAVIAIQNVRLFQELETRNRALTESLEQQTATSEMLRVISSSPTDVQPVFDAVAESAARLCEVSDVTIFRRDDDGLRLVAHHGPIPVHSTLPLVRGTSNGRAVLDGRTIHVADMQAETDEFPEGSENARRMGHRTILCVPLMREGVAIGTIHLRRPEAQRFTERQVALLQTFADQAVIAIENVRLFKELEARNQDLTEALEQQTATSEILRVISSSPTDVRPVFDTIVRSAARLCEAQFCLVFRFDDELLHLVTHHGLTPDGAEAVRRAFPRTADRGTLAGRSVLSAAVEQIPDMYADPTYALGPVAAVATWRSSVAVPMLRDGRPVGVITLARSQSGFFPDRQIELVKTFADQAVIAIENVRLFKELEERTQALTRSIGELRALGEVSQAVGSTLDLETVLATIVSHAVQLSGSDEGVVYEFDEATQTFHQRATHQITPEHVEAVRAAPIRLGEGAMGRAGVIREPVEVADIEDESQLVAPQVRGLLAREGMRSLLAVPLVREEQLLGGLVILRRERGAFSPEVVATLQTFAAQSVLAIHNAGLFREIQRQKQYSDVLVETSPVAIATMDLRGAVVGWNPGAERLFGYTQAEAMGRALEDLVATPEIREEVRAGIQLTLRRERVSAIRRRARKDGTLVDVETAAVPVVVDGVDVGIIAIYHDITDLVRARQEAEAANEAKSAFLATMSHEIRTPMNAVIGMSGLLLNTALTDEQREYAEVVRQSGDALLTVINDVLDFSKIEAGKLELESQPFDLRECVESALDLVATRAAEKGLDLAYLVGEGTPAGIVGDVTRLRQILLNLLSNAVKFTESGEVVLSVSAVHLDGGAPLHELTFAVRDTGIGIPPDRLGHLFQSFSQVDASTTRRYGGTGLGLAISQRLTELMGGRISVTSEVGRGSEFRFTIRARAAEVSVPSRRDLSGVQPSLRGKLVLVVDDNATNRRIVTAYLDAWGMRARASGSPIEAAGWIGAGEHFDVGILDMHMPEMDGVTLARAIREHPAGESLPLVLFTSLGRREARAESEGFAAYLHKPIKPSQLFDTLVSILAERPVLVRERGLARSEFDPDMARRNPLRILLAEDNIVNQKVALRLLGQMGYRADLAANGLEAIDAVERQTYDVVLMDVQMPELDGFEASREINRRWPGKHRPRIVAMTANAMQGDRELCAAAGMDDYVSKPIRVEELIAALERCRWRPEADERGAPPADIVAADALPGCRPLASGSPGEPSDVGQSSADPEGISTVASLDRTAVERLTETMGGPFVAELIDTFVEDRREIVTTLRRALAEADIDSFRRAAHSLKSNSETLGATSLAALARELETMARAGSLHGAGKRLDPLIAAYETAVHALGGLRRDLLA